MNTDASGDMYAAIARKLSEQIGVEATLDNGTSAAVSIIDGCDYAGISLVRRRSTVETVAPTDRIVVQADQLQYETGEGPCLQSIDEHETVYARNLLNEPRWPKWAPRVADELGIRSVLAVQLFVGPNVLGALNLFSETRDAFDSADRASALTLAAHIAVAMTAAQSQEHLDSALANRTVIGQAEGMLMQALGLTPVQAFAALTRVSQNRNVKLHLIAADIVNNGIRAEVFD